MGEGGSRSSDPDTYGATGHTPNPLSETVVDLEGRSGRGQSEGIRTTFSLPLSDNSPVVERPSEHDLHLGSLSEPLVTYRV